ncbi:hypothetical protein, partial [Exiguobacterium chiriqhucha]|uniref:hypothetical protein n=1 Tax=Exiguobacterium chiriqhucha TaxID=1385984 RepID=UPI0023F5767C
IEAWIEIPLNKIADYDNLKTPKSYHGFFKHNYYFTIKLPSPENRIQKMLFISKKPSLDDPELYKQSHMVFIDNEPKITTPVLKSNEDMNIEIPPHVLAILSDHIYRMLYESRFSQTTDMQLVIKYKTSVEIDTNTFSYRKYKIKLSNVHVIEIHGHYSISLNIDFDFLD